jgi:hypothetical protein
LLAGQGVPDQSILIGIAEALANFHATWWEIQLTGHSSKITGIRDWYSSGIAHSQHCQRRIRELDHFLSYAGNDISPEICSILEKAVERLPYLWKKYLQQRVENYHHLTLTQGDCYITQFLVPRQTESGQTYLVDFDSVSGNFPAYDLVYLLPTFWNRTQRLENSREMHFLQHYHTILCQAGVKDYCFADLCQDYRLMLCYMLLDAPADQVRGSSTAYWRPKLRCLVEAYQDWECASL